MGRGGGREGEREGGGRSIITSVMQGLFGASLS